MEGRRADPLLSSPFCSLQGRLPGCRAPRAPLNVCGAQGVEGCSNVECKRGDSVRNADLPAKFRSSWSASSHNLVPCRLDYRCSLEQCSLVAGSGPSAHCHHAVRSAPHSDASPPLLGGIPTRPPPVRRRRRLYKTKLVQLLLPLSCLMASRRACASAFRFRFSRRGFTHACTLCSHYLWLRDHCREARSYHPATKQRLVDTYLVSREAPSRPARRAHSHL